MFSPGTGGTGRFRPSVAFPLQGHALRSCPPVAPRLRHWACRPAGSCGREWAPSSRSGAAAVGVGGRKEGRGGWMMRSLSLCSRRTAWPCPLPLMSRVCFGGRGCGQGTRGEYRVSPQNEKASVESEWSSLDWILGGLDCLPHVHSFFPPRIRW